MGEAVVEAPGVLVGFCSPAANHGAAIAAQLPLSTAQSPPHTHTHTLTQAHTHTLFRFSVATRATSASFSKSKKRSSAPREPTSLRVS